MEHTWTGTINLGIVHPMIYPETLRGEGPILETVTKILTDDSFWAIEVSWIKDSAVRTRVASLLEISYMDVVYCGGPPILMQKLDMNSLDEKIGQSLLRRSKSL